MLVDECRSNLSVVLPLNEAEREFLDEAHVDATLLTDDAELQRRVQTQPPLQMSKLRGARNRMDAAQIVIELVSSVSDVDFSL